MPYSVTHALHNAARLLESNMTKAEQRETALTLKFGQTLGADYMARALSALYRAARTTKSRNEILAIAQQHNLATNPEFII